MARGSYLIPNLLLHCVQHAADVTLAILNHPCFLRSHKQQAALYSVYLRSTSMREFQSVQHPR
jgi:hypothetical protein